MTFSSTSALRLNILLIATIGVIATASGSERLASLTIKDNNKLQANAHHERGREIYNFRCYYCHGYSGDARTLSTTFLDPKPRDFTSLSADQVDRKEMIKAVRQGRPGTAMAGFGNILTAEEITTVVDFLHTEFITARAENTRYHTAANGWPNHQRYSMAFPFASGEIALDTPWQELNQSQRKGKRLFLNTCISCHDRAHVTHEGPVWEASAVSYPRNNTSFTKPVLDAMSGASAFAVHDKKPKLTDLSRQERHGESLYQANCAFCHAADGSGRNWIGSFMQPHPRDLTDPTNMTVMTHKRLHEVIKYGLKDTSMPAWKDVLSATEIDAIISYIERAFHPLRQSGNKHAGRTD